MLDAIEALFFKDDTRIAVTQQRQTRIMRGKNQPQNIHVRNAPDPNRPALLQASLAYGTAYSFAPFLSTAV